MQMQEEKLIRLMRHARKKMHTSMHGLRPSGIRGRFIANKILLNSIPKAGTHLLENALESYPLLRNAGYQTINCWESITPAALRIVSSIRKGAFLNAHLTGQPELFELIRELGIKVLFMIRDPRDIVVSYYKYVTAIDRTHPQHDYFVSLPDDDARLLASIENMEGQVTIGEVLKRFQPWLEDKSVFVCRFEHLIGPRGRGDSQQQLAVLRSIADYLEIPVANSRLQYIADRTYSSRSSTFRQGKKGGWSDYFTPKHVEAFKAVAGEELISYGYESSYDW
jgi:hypothetical protein